MKFNPHINPYPSKRNVVYAKQGMVATSQPLAAEVGRDILKAGGNAVDAAIAVAACLTVVEPTTNGIGGDAFAIVWMKGKLHGLNASGPAPKAITVADVKSQGHKQMPTFGWLPVTVPGTPSAWASLSEKFGVLSLSDVLAPAIGYAENGYPVTPTIAEYWQRTFDLYKTKMDPDEFSEWYKVFAPQGRAPIAGEIVKFPDHAKTLREIAATNAHSFYEGRLAGEIVKASNSGGGFFTHDDLSEYEPSWVDPISINYRGYDVWELPPNGQGIIALTALNILKKFDFTTVATTITYHRQIEAIKMAFTDAKTAITDICEVDGQKLSKLLSSKYGNDSARKINDEAAIIPKSELAKGGTVYLATADSDGNMVSYIQSNYMGFGSGIVIPGTGIAMQNRGADFSLDEEHPNVLAGGKKTYHTIIPGFLTRDNQAIGPFGLMGGFMQPQGHVQLLINSIDFMTSPQTALDAPRFMWIEDDIVEVEAHFPTHIARELMQKGHKIKINPDEGPFGRGQIIWRDLETGVLMGATDPRCDGHVAVY